MDRLETSERFIGEVIALRKAIPARSRYKEPCTDCAKPPQRLRNADNEIIYCADFQTSEKLLSDRYLSCLIRKTGND
tara:strand:+ start:5851 stop:6081 length:231 start_codon:yes stop_codon:yes gene_type:complete